MDALARILSGGLMASTPGPTDDFWYSNPGSMSAAGVKVNPEQAETFSAFYRGVWLLSSAVAMLPLPVYRRLPDGGKERATNHPLYELLHDRPNTWQTSFEWRRMMMRHIALRGNGYNLIVDGPRGFADQLIPLHPDLVTPEQLKSRRIIYHVRDQKNGTTTTYTQDEIFHLRGASDDGVTGKSVIAWARDSIGLALATEGYAARLFSQGAMHGGVITHPGTLNDEASKRMARSFKDATTGPNNWHSPVVLEQGVDWKPMTMTAEDSQYLLSRKFSVTEMARWLGVPPHKMFDLERCMPAETLVFTEHGPKRIVDVKVGERVWSWDGSRWASSRVLNTWANGVRDVLEIKTTNRTVRCTPNHRLLVRRRHERPLQPGEVGGKNVGGQKVRVEWRDEYCEAGRLKAGDTLITLGRLPSQNRTCAPTGRQLTVGFMEFAGLLLGDGNVLKNKGVSIARADHATYMNHYRDVMRAEFVRWDGGNGRGNVAHAVATAPVTLVEGERSTMFSSVQAAVELTTLGLSGTAFTKRVPSWVYDTPDDLRLAFLRGFLDADGTVDRKGRITFYSANRNLIDDIRHLCLGLGIPVTNRRFDDQVGRTTFMKNAVKTRMWRFTCSDPGSNRRIGSHDSRYVERLGSAQSFDRKDRKYPRFGGARQVEAIALARIVSIQHQQAEPVYDIEVERDHCFIADGVVSHNSTNNNIEHQSIEWVVDDLMPWLVLWEQAIARDLILATGTYFAEFLVEGLLRGDSQSRAEFYSKLFSIGAINDNEIRQREGMNRVSNGDTYYVQGAMRPTSEPYQAAGAQNRRADDGQQPPKKTPKTQPAEPDARVMAIVQQSASRLLRKEITAVQKMAVRHAADEDAFAAAVSEFYAEHAELVAETLQLSKDEAEGYCATQAAQILGGSWTDALALWKADDYSAGLAALAVEEAA